MVQVYLALFIFFSIAVSFAQAPSHAQQWRDWIKEARSPATSVEDKEKVAQKVLTGLRAELSSEYQVADPKAFYEKVMSDPARLEALFQGKGNYTNLFTDFSLLVNQISVERKLGQCNEYRNLKAGMAEGLSSYDACSEGQFSHDYMVWETKSKGTSKPTQYSIPNFMYSENLQDILAVNTQLQEKYGTESDPPLQQSAEVIKKSNPNMKTEELMKSYGMMKLQNDAYQQSIFNAAKNALSLEFQYGSQGWSKQQTEQKVAATLETLCRHCSPTTKKQLISRLGHVMKTDIDQEKIVPKDPSEVAQNLCKEMSEQGYPVGNHLSGNDLRPLSRTIGLGRAKTDIVQRKRLEVLSQMAQGGGDGLLVLTETLTDLDGKTPASTKLSCFVKDRAKDAELVKQAGAEAKEHALEYAKKINEDFELGPGLTGVRKNLKLLLKTNPRAMGEALEQNAKMGGLSCELLAEVKANDDQEKYNDKMLLWGVAVVGGALDLTGVLAPLGSAITMAAIALGTGAYEYEKAQVHREKAELYEAAAFASGNTKIISVSQEEYKAYQSAKISAMVDVGLSPVAFLPLVKTFMKDGKSLREASELAAASVAEEKILLTEEATSVEALVPTATAKAPPRERTIAVQTEAVPRPPKYEPLAAPKPDPKEFTFIRYVKENNPTKHPYVFQKKTSVERLAEMYQNSSARDMQYLMDSKKVKPSFSGGEADIYVNPANNQEALKVWKDSRLEDFANSTKAISLYEEKIAQNSNLARVLYVSKIKEKGRNFIVKEFSPNSVELKKVLSDPEVMKSIKVIKTELLKSPDMLNQKMYQAITRRPPSANLHWDPATKKVIMIDALGF